MGTINTSMQAVQQTQAELTQVDDLPPLGNDMVSWLRGSGGGLGKGRTLSPKPRLAWDFSSPHSGSLDSPSVSQNAFVPLSITVPSWPLSEPPVGKSLVLRV